MIFSQEPEKFTLGNFNDTINETPEIALIDTIAADTLMMDSVAIDSIKKPIIEDPIVYSAEDSIVVSFDGQRVFLYKNASVKYQQIELTAYYIELDLETKQIYAEGLRDSTGTMSGKPLFKQGSEEYESETMRYNFETEKAFITKVVSKQGEGFILSDRTKKIGPEVFITEKAKYTTCDAEHPHFYMHLTKAKVISNNKIVTGPAYMVLEDFPLYFPILPFGYFPSTPTYSSGIIVPTYGEEANRGFFLREGGYYWAAGEYFDLALKGEIYSKGSWGTQLHTNYKKRYKFSGGFDFRYNVNVYGESGLDTYTRTPQYQVMWSHSQDQKANPSRTFSASVNLSSSGYDRQNSYAGQTGGNNYLQTQKSSSISYSQRFENTPFSMSVNLRHSQNSRDTTITLSLPEMTFTMAKVYPFRKKNRSGPVRFYEKFGINYTANMRNSISNVKEYDLLKKSFPNDWKNGIKHNIPLAFPGFNLAKYINVSPSISYDEKWYFKKYTYSYDEDQIFTDEYGRKSHINQDTIPGLSRVYDYSYSLSASTNIYGMFIPRNPNSRIKGIRHKLSPSASFSYRPDFGQERFEYWQKVQIDSSGNFGYYDVNQGGVYGGSPERGASGSISLALNNNLEMKMIDTKDTTSNSKEIKYKKVKLIDNFSLSSSYNLIADSLNMAPIGIRARTTVAGVSINMGSVVDPYMVNDNYQRINQWAWNNRSGIGKIGRLTSANLSFGMNFNSKSKKDKNNVAGDGEGEEGVEPGRPAIYDEYADFSLPWNFGFDYSFNYSGPSSGAPDGRFSQTLGMRGNVSLTEKWKIAMNTNFDIQAREFSYTSLNISRDLHCWQMTFNFVPFGYMKSYSFTINAKSAMLKDLMLKKQESHYDNF
ncbi:MAG TPA: LPS-assembly protein LptD [Prolixibacteraceae bacterium]|nr:LPS-assembly protein LptD [Prolixibacteraceae bacterium]